MFQDYMRSRLGINSSGIESPHYATPASSPTVVPTPVPTPTPSGVPNTTPPGFNPMNYHPIANPGGWPGHPMNPNSTNIGGSNTVTPNYNPYGW